MKAINLKLILGYCLILFFASCSKDNDPGDTPPPPDPSVADATTQKVTSFVYEYMNEAYLWSKEIPKNIDRKKEKDPIAYFDKLVYKPDDRWSYLSDNADELLGSLQGVETTFGYELALGKFSNADSYFAIIKYVYEGSPAEKAGLQRGNILLKMNGGDITANNYMDLFYAPTIELTLGVIKDGAIDMSDKKVKLTAIKMQENTVITSKIIDRGSHRIGYLSYVGYPQASEPKLLQAFQQFKAGGVTDVVLDLRYNPGGYATTAQYLSSILAPASAISQRSIYLKEIWNDFYMAYYNQQGQDLNRYFLQDIPVNMNLKRLYVLTTSGTASASEATIVGLSSYIDVIKIGTTTHGKYCGAAVLQPTIDDKGTLDPDIKNWAMSMVIYRFANRDGITNFKDGFAPDFKVEDDLFAAVPFGDETDAHLSKAIELITGVTSKQTVQSKTRSLSQTYEVLPDTKLAAKPWKGLMYDTLK